MHYLIDGYNLLHAMGVLPPRVGPGGLEKARRGLLGMLHAAYAEHASEVTVVFDAAGAPAGASGEENYQGILVRYAGRQEQADDLIEHLIRHDSAPKQLTVVSDEHRIQRAARRRHCSAMSCSDYLETVQRRRRPHRPRGADQEAKPTGSSDRQRWLDAFAGAGDDLKELGFDFGDDARDP